MREYRSRRKHPLPGEGTKQQIRTVNRSHMVGLLNGERAHAPSGRRKERRGHQGKIHVQDRQQRQQWDCVLSGQEVMYIAVLLG